MGKSILVIDTPENCAKCPCFLETATDCCGVNGKDIESREKPDWCPLHEASNYKGINADPYYVSKEEQYNSGWNDCLRKILNGGRHDG